MRSQEIMPFLQRSYDIIHSALWSVGTAIFLYFVFIVAPTIPAAQGRAVRIRDREIAAENEHYCAKWGIGSGTAKNDQCLLDLGELRMKIEERVAEESEPF